MIPKRGKNSKVFRALRKLHDPLRRPNKVGYAFPPKSPLLRGKVMLIIEMRRFNDCAESIRCIFAFLIYEQSFSSADSHQRMNCDVAILGSFCQRE